MFRQRDLTYALLNASFLWDVLVAADVVLRMVFVFGVLDVRCVYLSLYYGLMCSVVVHLLRSAFQKCISDSYYGAIGKLSFLRFEPPPLGVHRAIKLSFRMAIKLIARAADHDRNVLYFRS